MSKRKGHEEKALQGSLHVMKDKRCIELVVLPYEVKGTCSM